MTWDGSGRVSRRWALTDRGAAAVGVAPGPVVTDVVLCPVPTRLGLRELAARNRRWARWVR